MIKPAILRGAKEIAEYMGISRRTMYRYKQHLDLPLTVLPGGGLITTTSLLAAWYKAVRIYEAEHSR
jgi:predicted DNA-binding transcriptional regulator AlpA